MFAIVGNPKKGWALALLSDYESAPGYFAKYLQNMEKEYGAVFVEDMADWLQSHRVKARAMPMGGWFSRLKSFRFTWSFNAEMKGFEMLASKEDIAQGIEEMEETNQAETEKGANTCI